MLTTSTESKVFFSRRLIGKGRRAYFCNFCRKVIERGTSHECISWGSGLGIGRRDVSSVRAHPDCAVAALGPREESVCGAAGSGSGAGRVGMGSGFPSTEAGGATSIFAVGGERG